MSHLHESCPVNEPCGNECVNERVCVYNTDESSAYKKHKSEVSTLSATGSILISEFPSSLVMFPWLLHVLQRRLVLLQSLYQHRAGDPQIGSQNRITRLSRKRDLTPVRHKFPTYIFHIWRCQSVHNTHCSLLWRA